MPDNNNQNSRVVQNPQKQSAPNQGNNDPTLSSNNPTSIQNHSDHNESSTGSTKSSDSGYSSYVPQKYGGKKVIATIFSVLFIFASVFAGVLLVQRNQDLREHAKGNDHKIEICHTTFANDESSYIFEVDKNTWLEGQTPHATHQNDFVICKNETSKSSDNYTSYEDDELIYKNCKQASECQ